MERVSEKLGVVGDYEYFYFCKIIGGEVGTGNGPEFQPDQKIYEGKHLVCWVDLKKLPDLDLRPEELKNKIIGLN